MGIQPSHREYIVLLVDDDYQCLFMPVRSKNSYAQFCLISSQYIGYLFSPGISHRKVGILSSISSTTHERGSLCPDEFFNHTAFEIYSVQPCPSWYA